MPELPEAEVAARQLRERLVGARVRECWVGRADIVREGLSTLDWYHHATITTVGRQGKSVIIQFLCGEETRFLVAELGMTGLLLLHSAPTRHPQHTHFILRLERSAEPDLRYWNPRRFGRLSLLDQAGLGRYIARRFGHDPLTISYEQFMCVLGSTRSRLKGLLMRQQVIAGIGNIYANEILFRSRLHPDQVANTIPEKGMARLYRAMGEVLREAIAMGGSSVRDYFAPDGTEGQYRHRHLVYAKAGEPCPNACGAEIVRMHGERSSFYCPTCQRKRPQSASKT